MVQPPSKEQDGQVSDAVVITESKSMASGDGETATQALGSDEQASEGVVITESKVTREMKYFADLEKLSMELQEKSSTLEQYLYGVDPGRSARWNEIVFLLELCHGTRSASDNDTDTSVPARKSLPDAQRVKEIESLIGSLFIDKLSLDEHDKLEFIYSFRPLSPAIELLSSSFRCDTFQKISSFLGRDSTGMEYLNQPNKLEEMFTSKIDLTGSKKLLTLSSSFYLLYLALGELADLKHAIKIFRQQELPESMSFPSSDTTRPEEVTKQVSPPRPMGNIINSAISESLNSDQTRSDDQLHAQIAARMNDGQNLPVSPSGHQPPRPLSVHISSSPPVPSGYTAHRDRQSDQNQVSQAGPSRDDDHSPAVYNLPGPPYQAAPPQPPYNTVPTQYAPPHPPHALSHALAVPPPAFLSQRHPSHAQGTYAPTFQFRPLVPALVPQTSIVNADSGNITNSTIEGNYNDTSTRTDHRVNQFAGHISNTQTVIIQNFHGSPAGPAPALVPSSAFPSVPSRHPARPIDHLTAQMRETTITSSRYESHSRVPNTDDADFNNRSMDQSRNEKPKTILGQPGEDDYMQGQRGHPGEGSSRPGDLRPHLGKAVRGGRDSKISSKASSIPTRPSLKPSSYKENESARLPVQQSSSRDPRGREPVQQSSSRDPRGGETNTNFVVGSYRSEVGGGPSGLSKTMSQQPWGTGQPAALSDSPSRSSRKEKERDRSSMQQSSSRPDPRSRGTDEDYGVGGLGSVSQGRSGYKEKESVRPLVQQNSSRQDPRAWGRDDDYVTRGQGLVGSYRGEAGGGTSGQPQPWTGNPAFAAQKPSGRQPEYTSGGSSRISYTERDHHASNIPMETMSATAHSPRYPPYTRATMPQRREEERPWYNTPVSGSHVVSGTSTVLAITAGALLVADLWRRGRSQSEDPNQTNPDGPSSPTEGSSPPEDPRHTTNSDTRFFTTTTTHPSMRKRFTDIIKSQIHNLSQQTQPLGNPCLVPFIKGKGNEDLGLSKNVESHTPLYMCSNIIDEDTIAFWFPAPTLFPSSGGRRGVQLGDLGYFNDSGEFRPIFNIFHSYEQNIEGGARPPYQSYQPYQPLPNHRTWVRQVDIQRQQTYTSSNIEKRGEVGPHTQNTYQFRTYRQSGRSGAIIVLPHGGSSSCIRNSYFHLPEVKQHFRKHAPSWYQHALPYIPKKNNGSLILVRATHCARSWGIAAFASKRDIREPLTATFISNPANEYQHMWQTNDSKWKTSTGPSFLELKELGGREPPLNQCIGAVISSLRLDDATWQANFESLSSPSDRASEGGWDLRRVMSRDSWSTIRVNDNSGMTTRRLLDSIQEGPTNIRHASGGDDYTLLLQEP